MHVRMLCLGRHWNARTYEYEPTRGDFDGLPVPPLPADMRELAQEIATATGRMSSSRPANARLVATHSAGRIALPGRLSRSGAR